jgi:hypothetical protein
MVVVASELSLQPLYYYVYLLTGFCISISNIKYQNLGNASCFVTRDHLNANRHYGSL